jgi:hypothetical protein
MAWHGMNRNQGATGEHDEQYQMSVGTLVNFSLKPERWYPPLQLLQSII